jgi:alpha-1,2-mannosyltransferase
MRFVHRFDGLGDRLRSSAQPWEVVVFVWVPVLVIAYTCWYALQTHHTLQDFGVFRSAALAVIHGHSPYSATTAASLSRFDTLPFVYPPAAALLFSPFAAFPPGAAGVLMFVVGLGAVVGALRLLGVEDWRCYGVALVSAPAVNSLGLGALTSLLLLGTALAWRYRDTPGVAGAATAVTALLKLFLWPLAVWLLVTKRWRAAVLCVGLGAVLLLGGWALIDFAGLRHYPTLVHLLQQVEGPVSYSVIGLLGVSGEAATATTVVLSVAAVAAIWLASRSSDGDRRAFAVAVLFSLLATPLLWLHYLLLVYVPIALYRPRLSGLWVLPLVLWVTPSTHSHGTTWRIALGLAVVSVVALRTAFDGARLSRPRALPRPAAS